MEAQIMDWSDDVAYSVHDFEDSLVTGQVRLEQIHKDLAELFEVTKSFFMADITNGEVEVALANLQNLSCWPKNYDGSHRHLARLKDLASQLVGRFAVAAESATREQYGHGPLTRFSASLIVPREQRIEVALLKSIATYYVINASASQERYAEQQKVIRELLEMVAAGAPATLDSFFQEDWRQAQSPQEELRVIVDQIASLTDPGAYAMHRRLSSIRS
jgi:dGTPase